MSSPKVFGIGFNKTGTTSLTNIFQQYGLKTTHHGGWHFWVKREQFNKFKNFDAFTDGQQKDFRVLDKKFPGSKFILNTRPLRNWLASRWCHVETNKRTKRSTWRANSTKDLMSWAYSRDNYHADVLEYFKDRPDDFMILDIQTMSKEDIFNGLDKVLQGVAKKEPRRNIPRSNGTNASLKGKGKKAAEQALEELGLPEEDRAGNTITELFKNDAYPEDIEKLFYTNHKTKPQIWYEPFNKKVKFEKYKL